jgi:hypothetical protein
MLGQHWHCRLFRGRSGLQVHRLASPSALDSARDQLKAGEEFWGDVFGHALGHALARGCDQRCTLREECARIVPSTS